MFRPMHQSNGNITIYEIDSDFLEHACRELCSPARLR
jgi:hypothetical protein